MNKLKKCSPKYIKIGISISIFMLFALNIKAQETTASFLYWQPSSRSYSMGGIGATFHDNVFSTYYNPAGLAFSDRLTVSGSFVKPFPFFGGIVNSFFGVSYNSDEFNSFAISGDLFWMGKQVRTFEFSPDPLGIENAPFHWLIKFSYSRLINRNFSAGISLGILNVNLTDRASGVEQKIGTETTLLFDGGILLVDLFPELSIINNSQNEQNSEVLQWLIDNGKGYNNSGFSFGISVSNIGPEMSFVDDKQADLSPTKLLLGFSYNMVTTNQIGVLIGTDYEKRLNESNNSDYLHFGGELKFYKVFNFRIGYFMSAFNEGLSYFTYGGGISLKYISFNFARYNRSIEYAWHFDTVITLEF